MPSAGRYLHRPFCLILAVNLAEIEGVMEVPGEQFGYVCLNGREFFCAVKKLNYIVQIINSYNLDLSNHGGFPGVFPWKHDSSQPHLCRLDSGRQCAVDAFDASVQRQFSREHVLGKPIFSDDSLCRQNTHGYRKVKTCPLFLDIRRSEIDSHPVAGKAVPGIFYGGFYPVLALSYGCVGKTDGGELREAPGDIHFYINRI